MKKRGGKSKCRILFDIIGEKKAREVVKQLGGQIVGIRNKTARAYDRFRDNYELYSSLTTSHLAFELGVTDRHVRNMRRRIKLEREVERGK